MKHFILMTLITLFIGCGSSPSSKVLDTPYVPEKQQTPNSVEDIFTIGDDQNVLEGSSVKISASIFDNSKEFIKFTWTENGKVVSTDEEFTADNLSAGEHHISLEVVDQDGKIYEDTVVVIIKKELGSNKPPVAKSLNFVLKEDEQFLGSLGGSDEDGDELSYLFVSFPQHGRLSGSAANLRYIPNANYNGSDSFVYKTNDGTIDSQYATVSIEIEAVNDVPVGVADSSSTLENTPISIDVLANDSDVENALLTIGAITQPKNGTVQIIDNAISYTANQNFHGTDTFTYQPRDGLENGLSVMVTVTVERVNNLPKFTNNAININTNEDNSTIEGVFRAIDADGNDYHFTTESTLTGFRLDENGSYNLNLTSDFYQSLNVDDNITKTVLITLTDDLNGSSEQNLTIVIVGKNDKPRAHDFIKNADEDSNISWDISSYVEDIDNNATFTLLEANTTKGAVSIDSNGTIFFSPIGCFDELNATTFEHVIITYKIQDEHNATAFGNINVTIMGLNDVPIITTINSISIDENVTTGIGQIVVNDAENTILTFESNSTLINFIDSNGTYTFDTNGNYNNLAEGESKIIPISITISDGDINITQEINVTIIGVNTPPVADIGMSDMSIQSGESITFDASSSYDVDGNITYHWSVNSVTSSSKSFSHTFTTIGECNVTLTVTDDKNATDTASITITVNSSLETSFISHQVTTNAKNSEWLEMVDLDQDGDLDILSASTGNNGAEVAWYENHGDNTFSQSIITANVNNPESIKAVDIDSDGDLDIYYTTYTNGASLMQCINDGSQNFTCNPITNATNGLAFIKLVNFDTQNDNLIDIITASWDNNKIEWLKNSGDGSFTGSHMVDYQNSDKVISIDTADFNKDGKVDIIAAHNGSNRIDWYAYNTQDNGNFKHYSVANINGVYSVDVADIDGDGYDDIIASSNGDGKVYWYKSTQSTSPTFGTALEIATLTNVYYASGIDMDNDGDIDILSASSEAGGKIAWYENIGEDSNFTEHIIASSADNVIRVYPADLDNDGNIDVVAGDEAGKVIFYENNATTDITLLPQTGVTTSIVAGDDGNLQKGSSNNYTRVNSIVTDNKTDLMWQYDSSENDSSVMYQSTAVSKCENLNIGGYDDWRIPEIHELYYLLDRRNSPAIHSVFDTIQTDGYWVSDNKSGDYSWVDFANAMSNISNIRSFPKKHVRCVRGKKYEMKFIRNDTLNIVTDYKHNLQWQDNPTVTLNSIIWDEAIGYCSTLDLDGTGWRLPNINELYSIVKLYQSPTIYKSFSNVTTDNYWSSTADNLDAVKINFSTGVDNSEVTSNKYKVRCVRDIP